MRSGAERSARTKGTKGGSRFLRGRAVRRVLHICQSCAFQLQWAVVGPCRALYEWLLWVKRALGLDYSVAFWFTPAQRNIKVFKACLVHDAAGFSQRFCWRNISVDAPQERDPDRFQGFHFSVLGNRRVRILAWYAVQQGSYHGLPERSAERREVLQRWECLHIPERVGLAHVGLLQINKFRNEAPSFCILPTRWRLFIVPKPVILPQGSDVWTRLVRLTSSLSHGECQAASTLIGQVFGHRGIQDLTTMLGDDLPARML